MNRNEFDTITSDLNKDGVKMACYVVREYIRCERSKKLDFCAVSKEEFDNALNVLLAFSYQNSDNNTLVEQCECESDCNRNNGLNGFCSGEFQLKQNTNKVLCKHYSDPRNI